METELVKNGLNQSGLSKKVLKIINWKKVERFHEQLPMSEWDD